MLEQLPGAPFNDVLQQVKAALNRVADPCSIATGVPIGLCDMGMLKDVSIDGNNVDVVLRLTSPICWQAGNIIEAVEKQLREIMSGTVKCAIDHSAEWMPHMMADESKRRLRQMRPLTRG
jgi:metal-sulfur cluster biosynthetic enzyme